MRTAGVLCRTAALATLAIVMLALPAFAHEVRPAYLEMREEAAGLFRVLWKTPMLGEARLSLSPEFSGETEITTPVATRTPPGAAIEQWTLRAPALRGQTLHIIGLAGTMTDTLARIEFADGTTWVQRLTPREPAATIPARQSGWSVAGVYLRLGVEHILSGIDHLLFVLALLLITHGTLRLVKTVTAFTVAHSITLAMATLGLARVPAKPVEAVIALSIVFVAVEIIHARRGRPSLAARSPWLVAFAFGLLHGFGFAGALRAVGLPQGHIPVALLFFNVGVEIGQLLFIAAILGGSALWRRIRLPVPAWVELVPAYAIGCIAMFWVFERIAAF